jgi:GT2 family glycosyltransferase
LAIAHSFTDVQVLQLTTDKPSAAKARNLGLRSAKGSLVQLVDGDSVLQTGWLQTAAMALTADSSIACVFGQCIEMFPEQSVYMQVCGLDWHVPAGDRRLCGGNSMWRAAVLAQHQYFDESLQLGEEPDLCYRVRQTGLRIVCITAPMVLHDLAMVTFSQYWRRGISNGKAYAKVAARYWRNPEKMWLKETLRNFAEPIAWLAVLAIGSLLGGVGIGLTALLVFWLLRAGKIALVTRVRAGGFWRAWLYGLHCQLVRVPVAIGQIRVLLNG